MSIQQTYSAGALVEQWDDTTRLYTDFRTDPDTVRPYTLEEGADADARAAAATEATNEAALLTKARTALQGNATFLALASPTTAQAVTQVKALTRQVNALIKLEVRDLLDTTGT